MTNATATLCDVTSFDGRIFPRCDYRRVIRGVVIGVGAVVAACALVTSVTVTATWIISAALSTKPTHATAPIGPWTLALAKYDLTLVGTADVSGPARVSTGPANAPDVTFEARWARVTASAPSSTMQRVPMRPLERANNVSSPPPHPLEVSGQAKPEIAHAPELTRVAKLTPAVAPGFSGAWHPGSTAETHPNLANSAPLPRPHPTKHEIARSPVGQANPQVAAATPPPASISEKSVAPQQAYNKSLPLPELGSRTAVYDISARTVYLPNGDRLEAHSGLGDKLDDPRYVHVRMRGPTPPNVYDLTLRARPFHGVRAIRLNPVDEGKMFGRAGMLAHTYMLGPHGQSNGCVSFRDYPKFLQAFLRGEIDRLVVVPYLGTSPSRIARAARVHVSQYASNNQ
jgi:type VI secretion system (T6SS) effector TldE1-like protein